FRFSHPLESKFKDILNAPLRLVLYGAFTSYIFLNDTLIGRYYGNGDCAQHDYYLMDGLLKFGDDENQITMMGVEDNELEVKPWIVRKEFIPLA
ncbi:10658_t:CDS:2, partial [Cetraspora pellucida]